MPLVSGFEQILLQRKADQEEQRRVCGNCYDKSGIGFVLVNEMGEKIKLDYLSRALPRIQRKHGLRQIRIHDLRHSHASLLIEMGFSPLLISERLGHEDIKTTLQTYSHLYPDKQAEVAAKLQSLF